jgi:nucleoside-diphosphate-sugar epimerase
MSNCSIYFVTGAAGFVGRHVCRLLTSSGIEVRALVRRADAELAAAGVKLWQGDLWDEELLRNAISGVHVVIHCAGDARFGNGKHYHRANVELTEHVVRAAKCHAKEDFRFIFVSTIGAIDRQASDRCDAPLTENSPAYPTSDYGKSKLQAEDLIRRSNIPFTIVRPAMVVGDDMRHDSHFSVFARQSIQGSLFARLAWPGRLSVVHADDLASAILAISTHPEALGQTYFCAGEVVSVAEFFRQCSPKKARVPLKPLAGVAKFLAKGIPFALKAMLLPALTASDKKLRALGWLPRHSARSALDEVIDREKARCDPDVSPGGQTVITGAASGLGRAFACYLSPRRGRLLLIDKDRESLEELANSLGNCVTCIVDLADDAAVDALLESPQWRTTHITELYACAGIGLRGSIQDISIENHRKMFSVNVLARIAMTKRAIDSMQKRHFGRVVLISSSSAFQPLPFMATYAATNSALLAIGESWSAEVSAGSIHILTVCPGGMQTNFQKSGGVREIDGEKLMAPDVAVTKIVDGLHQRKRFMTISFRSFAMSMLARCLPRDLSVVLWRRLMVKMR